MPNGDNFLSSFFQKVSMRIKIFLILFSFIVLQHASAQKRDSVFVKEIKNAWVVVHKVQEGDNVFSVARRYHVPPSMLASANGVRYQDSLMSGHTVNVPLGAYNLLTKRPMNVTETRPLYYKLSVTDDLYAMAKLSGVQVKTLKEWNKMEDNQLTPGHVLLVGWIKYDATSVKTVVENSVVVVKEKPLKQPGIPNNNVKEITVKDTAHAIPGSDTMSEVELAYMDQTQNGQHIATENGSGVFFNMPLKADRDYYYAFHNTVPKGTIIRVLNPSNDKSVYVKVLGPMPNTKQYYNAIIGISDKAKEHLGVRQDKMWCELNYAPN